MGKRKSPPKNYEWNQFDPALLWLVCDPDTLGSFVTVQNGAITGAFPLNGERRQVSLQTEKDTSTIKLPSVEALANHPAKYCFVEMQHFQASQGHHIVSVPQFAAVVHAAARPFFDGTATRMMTFGISNKKWHQICLNWRFSKQPDSVAVPPEDGKADSLFYALDVEPEIMSRFAEQLKSGPRQGKTIYTQSVADAICMAYWIMEQMRIYG